ncbi:RNA-binding domain-containing [Lecanosticta acicola]|uniref:RNA-binding domain-containing n=1 Tax=Lecanosticta acicola TaxID=111012 RepID=A0AAI8YTW0_9PEZI|nr:RNA-binding domain-containing [Lecanosticta acicola]
MSADTKTRKRKSGDDVVSKAKKVKTTTTKSAERPAPLKSALKKSKVEKVEEEKPKGKKPKKKSSEVVEQPDDEADTIVSDADEGGAALTADQTAALLAGFSSDSEEDGEEEDGIEISKLPAAPTTGEVQKRIEKAASNQDPESTPGVVFLGRIPHGFYEPQMRSYFSQFGVITHLRLGRNKKTGKSQHHAFVEFESAAVADIVAKTMDKYLLFGHILQCRRVPAEQVKENMWKNSSGVKRGKVRPRNRIEGTKLRKGMDREGWEKRNGREENRRREKLEKLAEMDYEFEVPELKKVESVPVKAKAIEDTQTGAEDDDGVKLIEGKKEEVAPGVEKEVEKVVKAKPTELVEEKTIKRKSKATGATTTTTKKRKTKLAA